MNDPEPRASSLFVSGVSGFVGSEVVRRAREAGLTVRAPDEREVDILEPAALTRTCAGVDGVIHCAGLAHIFDKRRAAAAPYRQVNEQGTANVARAAREANVADFVLVSSVSVYGSGAGAGSDESAPCHPRGAYAESKLGAERRATEILEGSGTSLTILRMATIYGEGDPGNLVRLIRAIDRGRFVWIGSGANRKSLLYRSDAATACLAALGSRSDSPRIYNVSDQPCSMRRIVETAARHLERRPPAWRLPAGLALGCGAIASAVSFGRGPLAALHGTVRKWLDDDVYPAERIERELNFRPQVDLDQGLAREIAWFRQSGGLRGTAK